MQNISKAEYFAAHAPTEIPEWFKPVMRDRPIVPGPIRWSYHTDEHREWLKKYDDNENIWYDDEGTVPAEFKLEVSKRFDDINRQHGLLQIWESDYAFQRFVQWRAHYGQLMAEVFGEKKNPLPNTRGITAVNISRQELPQGGGEAYTIGIQFNQQNVIHIPVNYDRIKPVFAWFTGEQHREGNIEFVHIPIIPQNK